MSARLLVVDDDRAFRVSTAALLRADGHTVDEAEDGERAVALLRTHRYQLMVVDFRMPGLDGVRLVETLRLWGEVVPVLMVSGFGTIDTAVRALHSGTDDYLQKPVEPDVLLSHVSELLARRPSQDKQSVENHGIVGRSAAMRAVLDAVARVGPSEATVLITGETGTGKELVARAVHRASSRRNGPFVAVNCGALAEGILESELFGHARGAFTGAMRDRAGLFEAAGGGTIFLDEIGEMSMATQQRLLRVLQEREVTRVGDTRPTLVDVRVVAATHRDLRALTKEKQFREDLFYRLAVFPIELPPLRDRIDDLPLLVDDALRRMAARRPRPGMMECSPFALRVMRKYSWPGNVRELLSALEHASIQAGALRIDAQHLPEVVRESAGDRGDPRYRAPQESGDERSAILAALEHSSGGVGRAAQLLGMGRTTLWRKMRALGIEGSDPGDLTEGETSIDGSAGH
ncbi:MAG: sigma-54 dependent transcriptional regulator [Gemmatimonadaceae bacterium]